MIELNELDTNSKLASRRISALRLSVALVTCLGAIAVPSGFAFATLPADPTAGAMADIETSVQTWVITYGIPVVFTLLTLGILVRLGMKWARRAGSKV